MGYKPKEKSTFFEEVRLYNRHSLASFIFDNVLNIQDEKIQLNFDLPFIKNKHYYVEYTKANIFSRKHNESIAKFAESPGYFINSLITHMSETANCSETVKNECNLDGKTRNSLDNILCNDLVFDDYYELDSELMIHAIFTGFNKIKILKQDTDLLLLCRNNKHNGRGIRSKLLVVEAKPFIRDFAEEEEREFLRQTNNQLKCSAVLAYKYQMPAQSIAFFYDKLSLMPRGIVLGMEYSPSDKFSNLLVCDERMKYLSPVKYLRRSGLINLVPRGCDFFD